MEPVKNTFGINMYSKLELSDNFFQCERIVKVSILGISNSIEKINGIVWIIEKILEMDYECN